MTTHRPLFGIALAFMGGIIVGTLWKLPLVIESGLLVAGLLGAILCRRSRWGLVFILIIAAVLGAWNVKGAMDLPRNHVSRISWFYRMEESALQGVIASDVSLRDFRRGKRVSFVLQTSNVCRDAVCRKVSGKVLVNMFAEYGLSYGDEIVLRGKLHAPFEFSERGRLSYRDYLRKQEIFLVLSVKKINRPVVLSSGQGNIVRALSLRCRSALIDIYERYLPPAEAGLMSAFMLGDRSNIKPHVRELFTRTGTAHVIAISGLNIAILAFMIFLALGILPISRAARTWSTIAVLAVYSFLVGGGAPVVRSAVMSSVFLLSYLIEREQDTLNTLAAAALVILVVDPVQLFDVGFQLSFVCVLSLLLWTPLILGSLAALGWNKRPVLWFFIESLAVSSAAWAGSVGLVAYYFGMITPVGLLANIPVVPLTAIVTMLGASLLIIAPLVPLAVCVAGCLKIALNLMVISLWLCSFVPGGAWSTGNIPIWAVATYYVLLFIIYLFMKHKLRRTGSLHDIWATGL